MRLILAAHDVGLDIILMWAGSYDISCLLTSNLTVYMCVCSYWCCVLFDLLLGEALLLNTHYTTYILQQGALWGYNCATPLNDHGKVPINLYLNHQ